VHFSAVKETLARNLREGRTRAVIALACKPQSSLVVGGVVRNLNAPTEATR
jgi:hypothetical protein